MTSLGTTRRIRHYRDADGRIDVGSRNELAAGIPDGAETSPTCRVPSGWIETGFFSTVPVHCLPGSASHVMATGCPTSTRPSSGSST